MKHLLEIDKPEALYLASDDLSAPRYEVVEWLARAQGKPAPIAAAAGQASRGKRVGNNKLRNSGFEGQVTLIGEEPAPPYQRPPLSKKYLLGEMELERLYLRPESFYAENGIDLRLGANVSAIDRAAQEVVVGGERLAYDHLVLTTGSIPRRLPACSGKRQRPH